MRAFRFIFAFLLAIAASATLRADTASSSADAAHLHVQLVIPAQTLRQGSSSDAGLYFKIDPTWHIYWKNAGDSGEPPHIKWTLPDGITASSLEFPPPKRLPLGPLMDFGYENEVLFPFHLDVAPSAQRGHATLHAKVDWLVCQNVCIPGKAELEIKRDVVPPGTPATTGEPDASLWERWADTIPKPLAGATAVFQPTPAGFRLQFDTGRRELKAEFFPADQNIVDNPAPQKVTPTAKGLVLELKKDAELTAAPAALKGVIELSGGRNYEIAAMPGTVAAPPLAPAGPGFLRVAVFAFLGGLLLNLMPCVFPVLFLKGLALVNSGSEERHKLRTHGFVYTVGILVSFWVLVAVLLALRAAGAVLGWGFQFQSPIFLALMAGLLFFLGLSLAGQFEIGLSLTSAGGTLAAKQGYTGSFFTGVLAVVVATPCTAPFMAAAIGYALAQPPAITFAVFTALALGLAAPYVALTLQPAWTRLLPKPGAWMEILRQAVSVPIFGTVIWLAWVLANAYGAAVLAALLAGFLLLAIAGWFLGRWPAKRWATVTAGIVMLGAICLNLFSARFAETRATFDPDKVLTLRLKPGSYWESWSAEKLARYQAQGRPVFVDFTASWCLSCQVNERVALDQPQVMQAFQAANVALLKADWTREDPAITQALAALGRSGVPVYALYAPGQSDPQLLPQVLTPGIVTDALEKLPRAAAQTSAATSNVK